MNNDKQASFLFFMFSPVNDTTHSMMSMDELGIISSSSPGPVILAGNFDSM